MSEKDSREEARELARKLEESTGEKVKVFNIEGSNSSDVQDILKAVSEFIKSLEGPIMKLIDVFLNTLNGEKLGSDIAAFYTKLRDAGMPEDVVVSMTKEYFEKRTAIADLTNLIQKFVKKEILEEEEGSEEE